MEKYFLILVMVLFLIGSASAADVNMKWDPNPGATGYKIQKSIDLGVTWSAPIDVGNVLKYTYVGVEENVLVLFRTFSYNAVGESPAAWFGAWYDNRKKPIGTSGGVGVDGPF